MTQHTAEVCLPPLAYSVGLLVWLVLDSIAPSPTRVLQGQDQINIPDCQHPSADPSDTKEYISEVFLNAGCYKKTTDINDKFLCGWEPNLEHPGIMYTTHYCIENYECYKSNPMNSTSCHIYRKDLLKGHLVTFWVNASNGKKNFTSTIYKFTLENSTKFIPPTNINMSRSASNLTLIWESPSKEAHGSLNEIQYRRCDVQQKHLNNVLEKDVKCKSGGGTKNDNCSVVLDPKEAYRIRVRRRPQNESKGVWSEWSQTVFVPTELQSEPEADIESLSDLTEDGKRLLNLTFKASENLSASLGDLSYIVKIYIKNCQQYHLQKETRHTWYAFNISAAEHEVSIIATNKVGQSPVKTLQIPQANIKVTNVNSSLSEWKLENLKPNTIYLLDVAARTSEGEGPKHSTEFKTLQFVPYYSLVDMVLPPQQAVSASEEATSDIMVIPEVEAMSLLSVDATQTLTKDNESEDLLSDQGSLSESVLVVSQHYAMQSVNQENWEQSEDAEFEEEPVSEEPSDGAATTIYKKGLVLELCHVKN
ncbi:I12R1 protein, partial [Polypterus senegalus]|nr:I12R1 protein [Polypterus senegalus]